jgi:uncharacterized protein YegP (UPF0339 family)
MPGSPLGPIFKSEKDGQHYARLVARNGEILMSSEGHSTMQGAERNLRAAVKAALDLAPELINELPPS